MTVTLASDLIKHRAAVRTRGGVAATQTKERNEY